MQKKYNPICCSIGSSKLCGDAAEKFMNLGSRFVYACEGGLQGWADGGNRLDRSDMKMM